jgi:hypothetical protein
VAVWPAIEFAYAHLDRFLLLATAGCGETAEARQVPLPPPGEQPGEFDGFLP